jgi:tungstate transport system substrate-binding protein
MKRLHLLAAPLLLLALALAACAPAATPAATAVPPPANANLILATTTSTQDTGLLDVLVPLFEQQTGYVVKTVAVGTGQALTMGQQGNADVLLVHAPSSEMTFMNGGYGKDRYLVAHDDFIIVGPSSDPAHIKGLSALEAFKAIYAAGATFVSRGDQSGTNTKELAYWKQAGLDPVGAKPAWYLSTGQGMGNTLTVASAKIAYTLTDRPTYLVYKANLQLDVLVQGDPTLLNVYHVITVNPDKWPKVNYAGALAFAKWIVSPAVQDIIGKFGVDKYGTQLFTPDAGKTDAQVGLP